MQGAAKRPEIHVLGAPDPGGDGISNKGVPDGEESKR
jgi:hypothetical protein